MMSYISLLWYFVLKLSFLKNSQFLYGLQKHSSENLEDQSFYYCQGRYWLMPNKNWIGIVSRTVLLRLTIESIIKVAIKMAETRQRRKLHKNKYEWKTQLVDLYHSGKRRCEICRKYDISHSLFDKWINQAENFGSFHKKRQSHTGTGRIAKYSWEKLIA